jgi:hypothetical protein
LRFLARKNRQRGKSTRADPHHFHPRTVLRSRLRQKQRILAIPLFSRRDASYLGQTGGSSPVCFLRKEVIHVSLSLVRGIVAGVDHLDGGVRLNDRPTGD